MGKTIRIQVDESLMDVLDKLRREVAVNLRNKYGLKEITVPRTLSSQILAAKMKGTKILQFKLRKTSLNKGVLEILWFLNLIGWHMYGLLLYIAFFSSCIRNAEGDNCISIAFCVSK